MAAELAPADLVVEEAGSVVAEDLVAGDQAVVDPVVVDLAEVVGQALAAPVTGLVAAGQAAAPVAVDLAVAAARVAVDLVVAVEAAPVAVQAVGQAPAANRGSG